MKIRSCVSSSGQFIYGIHKPSFKVDNLREFNYISTLGILPDGSNYENNYNFPQDDVNVINADCIYEIPNAFPFKGTTYISKKWADEKAHNPASIYLSNKSKISFSDTIQSLIPTDEKKMDIIFEKLPCEILVALASTSTDPEDLKRIARLSCDFIFDPLTNLPKGIKYFVSLDGKKRPCLKNEFLFEVVANNPFMPDEYKDVMVLRPGIQGDSEIIGEWKKKESHVFEYLRKNSYIPWGHYAANMANDSIRYSLDKLNMKDITGMRHLYYQRTYVRLARDLGLNINSKRKMFSVKDIELLRKKIKNIIFSDSNKIKLKFNSTLWGWNFGFDYAPSKYRLHASHQQIHQQFAMIPSTVTLCDNETLPSYSCGDLIHNFIQEYRQETGKNFFDVYIQAIKNNKRIDGNTKKKSSIIIYEDNNIILFAPKAQTSQWEIQLMTLKPIGNILELDTDSRKSIDTGIFIASKVLHSMGAKMITTIEYSKRFNLTDSDQRLMYCFLPRLPESPGAFSEAQLRFINGHYPEDFAIAAKMTPFFQEFSKIFKT
ncbi:MAG: hypothetical protein HQK76_14040 [Desulfobacterales bacterium]|nr:hypothetical protein [Desulfobacterales bacterium]